MRRVILAAAILLAAPVPATAADYPLPTKEAKATYSGLWHAVKKEHGRRAPGRNIRRYGVSSHGRVRPASARELAGSIRRLRALRRPPAFLAVRAGSPYVPPARVATAHYSPTGLAGCIVSHESGGNPQANNGSHFGIAQWTIEAWLRHGGGRFAPTPLGASYQEQLQVLSDGLRRFGCRDWCPFDPC